MLTHYVDKLDNGLTVIRVAMPSVDSVTTLVFSNTGSRYEKPAQYGIAHFFEHMAFKGTKKYPSAMAIASEIDGIGADFNAFTSSQYTGYYIKSAAEKTEKALEMLAEMLTEPLLRQEDIDLEKGVIIEELNMYKDMPQARVGEVFERMVMAGSTLEHDVLGTKETILNMKSSDFKEFLTQWYDYSNLTLVLAGEEKTLSSENVLDLIKQSFSKKVSRVKNPNHEQYWSSNFQYQGKFAFEEMPIEQAHFVLGWSSIKLDDDRQFVNTLITTMLGGNMSSRLFTEIREKRGLCYYIGAGESSYHDSGLTTAQAGVNLDKTTEAIAATMNEYKQLATGKKPFTKEELQRAKDYVLGKLVLSLEDSRNVAQSYGLRQVLLGEVLTPAEKMIRIKAVTLDEVNDLAKILFNINQAKLAVVGKLTDKQQKEVAEIVS